MQVEGNGTSTDFEQEAEIYTVQAIVWKYRKLVGFIPTIL
jgi:hypothetical protein